MCGADSTERMERVRSGEEPSYVVAEDYFHEIPVTLATSNHEQPEQRRQQQDRRYGLRHGRNRPTPLRTCLHQPGERIAKRGDVLVVETTKIGDADPFTHRIPDREVPIEKRPIGIHKYPAAKAAAVFRCPDVHAVREVESNQTDVHNGVQPEADIALRGQRCGSLEPAREIGGGRTCIGVHSVGPRDCTKYEESERCQGLSHSVAHDT